MLSGHWSQFLIFDGLYTCKLFICFQIVHISKFLTFVQIMILCLLLGFWCSDCSPTVWWPSSVLLFGLSCGVFFSLCCRCIWAKTLFFLFVCGWYIVMIRPTLFQAYYLIQQVQSKSQFASRQFPYSPFFPLLKKHILSMQQLVGGKTNYGRGWVTCGLV